MRILTGLIEPTSGDGFVDGDHCTDQGSLVEHIGLLPEEPPLYRELTGREQLHFAADLRGILVGAIGFVFLWVTLTENLLGGVLLLLAYAAVLWLVAAVGYWYAIRRFRDLSLEDVRT